MEAARDAKDYVKMESVCRSAVQRGSKNEYLLRSLSFALCRQQKTEEGVKWAEYNWQVNRDIPSLCSVVDSRMDNGDVVRAKEYAKILLNYRSAWKQDAKFAQSMVERASSKVFELTWEFSTKQGEQLTIPQPLTTLNQQFLKIATTGCGELQLKKDKYENSFYETIATSDKISVRVEVMLSPFSLKPYLKSVSSKGSTIANEEFLAPISTRTDKFALSGDSEQVQEIVKGFNKESLITSSESMMNWINSNFTFCPPNSPPGVDQPEEVIKRKGGHCEAISSVEACLLRGCGVPARLIRGQSAVRSDMSKSTQHTIIQFYLQGIGWVDWDYFLPRWQSRDDFVRLWVYNEIGDKVTGKQTEFFGRAFQEHKGYRHRLIRTSLD
jgi:hypothetical protein